jgi:hypothetical protein
MEVFYEFPFTIPSEAVYIGRAASLIEGIGFIHDPWFDSVGIARPIIKEMAQEFLQEELQGDTLETLQKWVMRSYQTVTALQDVIIKADREQMRVRLHPNDLQSISTIVGGAVRKILIGLFAALLGLASSVIYLRSGDTSVLLMGILFSGFWILVLLLLPNKKPGTKQRHYIRKQLDMLTTEEGDLYKSLVIGQMTSEEREKAEAGKKAGSK